MATPTTRSRIRWWRRCGLWTLFFVYGVIPASVLFFPGIVSSLVFANSFSFYFTDLRKPQEYGLLAARHVALSLPSGDTLGIWHILPELAQDEKVPVSEDQFDTRLASGCPIFIYLHGNGGTRGQWTRIATYSVIRGQNYHVVSFDYRGYGDSTGSVSESNMVEDAVAVFQWVKQRCASSPVFFWGHSLGTGVAVQAARVLSVNDKVSGVILEGAFNNLHDVLDGHILTLPYRPFQFMMNIMHNALRHKAVAFSSDVHIQHVECPIIMLHSVDDFVIPLALARKLFQTAMQNKSKVQPGIEFHEFEPDKGYGHNLLNQAPDLGLIIRQFVDNSLKNVHAPC